MCVSHVIIYNKKKYTGTKPRPPENPWNFLSDKVKVCLLLLMTNPFQSHQSWCYEAPFGKLLGSLRVGAGYQGNQPRLQSWNFQSHPLKRKGLEIASVTTGPGFNQTCLRDKGRGSENFRVSPQVEGGGGSGALWERLWRLCVPFPSLALRTSFTWVLWEVLANSLNPPEGVSNLQPVGQKHK